MDPSHPVGMIDPVLAAPWRRPRISTTITGEWVADVAAVAVDTTMTGVVTMVEVDIGTVVVDGNLGVAAVVAAVVEAIKTGEDKVDRLVVEIGADKAYANAC